MDNDANDSPGEESAVNDDLIDLDENVSQLTVEMPITLHEMLNTSNYLRLPNVEREATIDQLDDDADIDDYSRAEASLGCNSFSNTNNLNLINQRVEEDNNENLSAVNVLELSDQRDVDENNKSSTVNVLDLIIPKQENANSDADLSLTMEQKKIMEFKSELTNNEVEKESDIQEDNESNRIFDQSTVTFLSDQESTSEELQNQELQLPEQMQSLEKKGSDVLENPITTSAVPNPTPSTSATEKMAAEHSSPSCVATAPISRTGSTNHLTNFPEQLEPPQKEITKPKKLGFFKRLFNRKKINIPN